jgi:hypothetical protein
LANHLRYSIGYETQFSPSLFGNGANGHLSHYLKW